MNYAILSCENGFTVFRFKNIVIRFKAPDSIEHYSEIKEWDHGYIVVLAKYKHNSIDEEEYIDLIPILTNLYIEPDAFLNQIEGVEIA